MANHEQKAPKRVCMLTHTVYRRDTRIRRSAECLALDGHMVDIICLASEEKEEYVLPEGIRVYSLPMRRTRREGFGLVFDWALSASLMFFYLSVLEIRNRYDLIHVHNMPDFLVFAALIPKLRGSCILHNVHDPVPEVAMSKLNIPVTHPLVRIQIFIERISIGFSRHVIAATQSFKRILVGRGYAAEKISVVTNAADLRFFKPAKDKGIAREPGDPFTLLYVGTVAHRYGLDVCIRALELLKKDIPGIRLKVLPKIVNEGKGLDECIELAKDLEVQENIELTDPVPLEEVHEIMAAADIGVYPARRDCHMDIALSLKIPEMVGVGLCVVASRLSVLEELYGDAAMAFVSPGNHEALAEKILELYRSPEMIAQYSRQAWERSKGFSWENEYKIYIEVLEKLWN